MTLDEFITKLGRTRRKWRLTDEGEIRSGPHCPMSALAGTVPLRYFPARMKLGLSQMDAFNIFQAADNWTSKSTDTRARLLAACHLREPGRRT